MKKFILYSFTALLAFTLSAGEIKAADVSYSTELPADSAATRLMLVNRLDEIKTMDKSSLGYKEKSTLRKEARSIEKNLNQNYGGVYISVGALILIIILLIIIF
ncbi:MAG: hypothetical protein M3R17_04460 [Bacteroidota bacterium]|nr:hypothetical protein [Bacteroidota bacterium]